MRKWLMVVGILFCNSILAADLNKKLLIDAAFDRWVNDGVLGGEIKASESQNQNHNIIKLRAKGLEDVLVGTARSVFFKFRWGLFSQNDFWLTAMREVRGDLDKTCAENGGKIEFNSFGVRGEGSVEYKIRDLKKESLYGDFVCALPVGNAFQVEVLPMRVAEVGLTTRFEWDIYVHLVSGEQLLMQEQRLAENKKEADKTQEMLQPGQQVAIRAIDLPDLVINGGGVDVNGTFLSGRKYMMCAMVIDVKPALVQVQIGKDAIYVPRSRVFPFIKGVNHKRGGYPISGWSEWCFM